MIVYCAACEKECSEKAKKCPRCGHPLRGPAFGKSKKFLGRKARTIIAICNVVAVVFGTLLYWGYRAGFNAAPIAANEAGNTEIYYRELIRESCAESGFYPTVGELDEGMELLRKVAERGRVRGDYAAWMIGGMMADGDGEMTVAYVEKIVNAASNVIASPEFKRGDFSKTGG